MWEKKLLGDHSPETLLNTMVFMKGLYFLSLLVKDLSSGTLKIHQRIVLEDSKEVRSSQRLLFTIPTQRIPSDVLLSFSESITLCVLKSSSDAFCLSPLAKPKEHCWFSKTPLGHNSLKNIVKTCAKRQEYRVLKQTTSFEQQQQQDCNQAVSISSWSWSVQVIAVL